MKLAEALILRADAKKRIEQLKVRLLRNARVQEGDAPAEEPTLLIAELERVTAELARLIRSINRTNISTMVADGLTIADAIAERDVLALRHKVYSDLTSASAVRQDRYTRGEVRYISVIDVVAVQAQADDLPVRTAISIRASRPSTG
jgi:hypothetical protein